MFGSRADGTSHLLSDHDVLYVGESADGREDLRRHASQHCIDLFILTLDELDNAIETGNSVLYDALVLGRVLYDTLGILDQLRERVGDMIEKRGLERTDLGWVLAGHR